MTEVLILATAGLLGSFLRAWMTRGQATWSRDTAGECFLGIVAGILWPTFGVKIVPFPVDANFLVKAAVVAGIAYIAGDVIQNMIPGLLGRLVGKKPDAGSGTRAGLIVLTLLTLGCATATIDPVRVSAETAAIVGEQAVVTNGHYVKLCADQVLPPAKCQAWAQWFVEFKRQYALAHTAFTVSMATGNATSAQAAAAKIQALATQLTLYAVYGQK
jgi:hypothetical protein